MSKRLLVSAIIAFLAFAALAAAVAGRDTGHRVGLVPVPNVKHPCGQSMPPPSYPGSTWTASELTTNETFSEPLLKHWNYGFTDDSTSGPTGYRVWAQSGTRPYWGSSQGFINHASDTYDLPGNVSQTSRRANPAKFSTYHPQVFKSTGCGLTITAHHTGPTHWYTESHGVETRNWTSGVINSYHHIYFPTRGNTQFIVQIRAQMMGYQGSNNGAWDALWFQGQGNQQREIDLQESGLSVTNSPNYVVSHLQTPETLIEQYHSPYDLSARYHTYAMQLANGVVKIYLDNALVGTATSHTRGPYFILLDADIFTHTTPWGIAPANLGDMQMRVSEIQVYQRRTGPA